MSEIILSAQRIEREFQTGNRRLKVLKSIDLDIHKGEAVCIVGGSGAGKSTLLHILGGLDKPTAGSLFFKGKKLSSQSEEQLALFRNKSIGFVFQFHHLLAEFTALENVAMPARIAGVSAGAAKAKAKKRLEGLGLGDRLHHFPTQLSGGEQQRVAIARALIQDPEVLLADEPTGNLDSKNDLKIQDLFFDLKENLGITLLVVTHNQAFASRFPRILKMRDGEWEA